MLLLLTEKSYRQISSDTGVSLALGSITNIKQRLEAHRAAIVRGCAPQSARRAAGCLHVRLQLQVGSDKELAQPNRSIVAALFSLEIIRPSKQTQPHNERQR